MPIGYYSSVADLKEKCCVHVMYMDVRLLVIRVQDNYCLSLYTVSAYCCGISSLDVIVVSDWLVQVETAPKIDVASHARQLSGMVA
jgi:hypothetical protein